MMKIAIVCGGRSLESEISVVTALKIFDSLILDKNFKPLLVYQDYQTGVFYGGKGVHNLKNYSDKTGFKRGTFKRDRSGCYFKTGLKKEFFDLVFPVVHGAGTEDGTMAAYFQTLGIPTLAPSIAASAVLQDKILFKDLIKSYRVKALKSTSISYKDFIDQSFDLAKAVAPVGFPLIIKPAELGSSIGIEVANTASELVAALNNAFNFTDRVLLEKYLKDKREVNIALIEGLDGMHFSLIEEVFSPSDFYTYDEKYLANKTHRTLPADITEDVEKKIKDAAERIYKHVGLSGVVRFDFFISGDEAIVNEVNTIPGSWASHLFLPQHIFISDLLKIYIDKSIEEINFKRKIYDQKQPKNFTKLTKSRKLKLE